MLTGTVKWFNKTKAYGFIKPDDGGPDIFVHNNAVEASGIRTLQENDKVSYELADERGKKSAVKLNII